MLKNPGNVRVFIPPGKNGGVENFPLQKKNCNFLAGVKPTATIIWKKTNVGIGFIPPEKFVAEGFIPSEKNKCRGGL